MTISDTFIPPYMLEKLCDYYALKKKESDSKHKASEMSWANKWEMQKSTLQTLFQRQNVQKDKDADTKEKGSLTPIKFKVYSFSDDDVADTSNLMTDPDVAKISSHMKKIHTFYGDALDSDVVYGLDNTMRVFLHAFKTTSYNNAFWSPVTRSVYYGDCDSEIFNPFTNYLEIACHLFTKGYLQFFSHLVYEGQSGALLESLGDVFGVTLLQKEARQKADEADWLIGKDLLKPHGGTRYALRSLKAPGTAYINHPIFGTDPQAANMRSYFDRNEDNKGVHYNSGIPNHAYYLAAKYLQGYSFDKPVKIWLRTVGEMKPDATFIDFANATVTQAKRLYGEGEANEVSRAWWQVDVLQQTEMERLEAERIREQRARVRARELERVRLEARGSLEKAQEKMTRLRKSNTSEKGAIYSLIYEPKKIKDLIKEEDHGFVKEFKALAKKFLGSSQNEEERKVGMDSFLEKIHALQDEMRKADVPKRKPKSDLWSPGAAAAAATAAPAEPEAATYTGADSVPRYLLKTPLSLEVEKKLAQARWDRVSAALAAKKANSPKKRKEQDD